MEEKKFIVGLDIGTTKVKVFIGIKNKDGKIEIIGMGSTESVGVERGEVVNPGKTADSIKKAIAQAEEIAKVKVSEVYVGVAGYHIQSRTVQGSMTRMSPNELITEDEVYKLHEDQKYANKPAGTDIIDIVVQSYSVDGIDCLDPVGMIGNKLEGTFNIVFGSRDCINKIIKSVETAGYKLKGLILQPVASADAVLEIQDKEDGVALVDIGGGTTDIAVFKQGFMRHIISIPMAGNHITNDIETTYKITRKNAENLKVKYGTCLPEAVKEDLIVTIPGFRGGQPKEIRVQHLAGVIQYRVKLMLDFILVELSKDKYLDKLQAIILTGGGSLIRHIKQFTEYHIADLVTNIGFIEENNFSKLTDEQKNPIYATALGLLIAAFRKEEEEEKRNPKPIVIEDVKKQEKTKDRSFKISNWLQSFTKTFDDEDSF
ncbi:MAG: cell division protein FtsA [Bacteroidales bacterium]|jgi:cell division protein FtsA|nr:cell division protein FtsA [Bacteroidales bacterium]